MGNNIEKDFDEKAFVKGAYQALIDRGVITEDMLSPSTVTDEMLDAFEREYEVKLPSLCAYIYRHIAIILTDFTHLCRETI